MNATWGTPETQPPQPPEPRLCAAHAFLALALASQTASIIGLVIEDRTSIVIFRGAYSVLAGLFVAGIVGWVVSVAERRVRREMAGERAELLDRIAEVQASQVAVVAALDQIRSHMAAQQRADRPGIHTPNRWTQSTTGGSVCAAAQPTADGDTMPLAPIPPETQAVLRRINMRLHQGGADGK